jgi:hypothetical protein
MRIDSWAPLKVYKYGLWLHRLAELFPWNRFLGSLKVRAQNIVESGMATPSFLRARINRREEDTAWWYCGGGKES